MTLLRPKPRTGAGETLRALLESDRFRLGRDAARVAHNLIAHGGTADPRALAWIGGDLPPHGAPSVTLGAARGTLGPHSFGFLDNRRGVAAFAAPLPVRPPVGSVALVCGRREALPDVGPLCAARALGVSWILSAGDGEVDALLAFLAADAATRAVLLAAPSLRPSSLAALAGKPAVLLGGDPLLRAAVRRAGGVAADDIEAWLAHGAILESGVARPAHPAALVIGAGATQAAEALRAGGLPLPVSTVSDEDPEQLPAVLAAAAPDSDLLLVIGGDLPPRLGGDLLRSPARPAILVDAGHLDRLRALAAAIALRGVTTSLPAAAPRAAPAEVRALLDETGEQLLDHDAKRLLKGYGVRVSRQGPANSATAALRIGVRVGLPVDVVAPPREPAARELPRRARTASELRRAAAVLLDEGVPYVLVREVFPDHPRARLAVRRDRGVGAYAVVADERALLPLDSADALLLARASGATPDATDDAGALLTAICAAAWESGLTLDAELFVGADPAVISASARKG